MPRILVVDSEARDAQRFQRLLAREDVEVQICLSGAKAELMLDTNIHEFAATAILWELAGPISGSDLVMQCRRLRPEMPVVVMTESLDASMATRAFAFGARDFLEKPVDSERLISCFRSLFDEQDPLSALVLQLRERILGESPAMLATLKQAARVIPYDESRVLLVGESGTGKELFAKAIHQLGPRHTSPWVAVNISGIPSTLIESVLFGYEKGAFTGAVDRHAGLFEEARRGTIFLDEIGELELSLQTKLLRVIQERNFRRLSGKADIDFGARLICATNRDLASAVNQRTFRRDLFHRIAEVTIQIPPLRERNGDIDLLLNHFLDSNKGDKRVRFAREALAILRSYPFWGNVREMENMVKSALIECEGDLILPQHLPLTSMGTLLEAGRDEAKPSQPDAGRDRYRGRLIDELKRMLPDNWTELGYRETVQRHTHAFDRVYLQHKLERWHHNITRAAKDAGVDTKTFRKRWRECGLPPLGEEEVNDD